MPEKISAAARETRAQARLLAAPPLFGVFILVVLAFEPPTIDVGETVLLAPRTAGENQDGEVQSTWPKLS